MKVKTFVVMSSIALLALVLAVAVMPMGIAGALMQGTPTPAGLSDFVIPSATPSGGGGGFAIPTATPSSGGGGFTIPTATPGAAVVVESVLPVFDETGLAALNLQPSDVPADFAADQQTGVFYLADSIQNLRDEGSVDAADLLEGLVNEYGYEFYAAALYTSCNPSVPVNEIYSDVGQISSPDLARAFVVDPDVQLLFADAPIPATSVNGFYAAGEPAAGACFAQEIVYDLYFEYWGVFATVSMTANADTDPGLIFGLLDQLAGAVIAHIDAAATSPLSPTPNPGTVIEQPPVVVEVVPTATPAPTSSITMQDIMGIMPTSDELGMTSAGYVLNEEFSRAYTVQEVAGLYQQAGEPGIAAAYLSASQRSGNLGQVARLWESQVECPQQGALNLEVDVTLFATAQGAQGFLADAELGQAMSAAGIQVAADGDGVVSSWAVSHPCGDVVIFGKLVTYGPFLLSASATVYTNATQQEVVSLLDIVNNYVIEKIDAAGLAS